MNEQNFKTALIVGAGDGLSASLARRFAREGMSIALAARNTGKLQDLCTETGAKAFACDASEPDQVAGLFAALEQGFGNPDVVVYNASARARGPFDGLRAEDVERSLEVGAFGGFLVAQQAVKRMLPEGNGAILFTGASASVKGYAQSAPFAMAKFALRGLAQSMARELAPQGIHVAHFVIDGSIRNPGRVEPPDKPGFDARSRCDRRRPICTCSASRAAPGPGKSSSGPGWRSFDRRAACACTSPRFAGGEV